MRPTRFSLKLHLLLLPLIVVGCSRGTTDVQTTVNISCTVSGSAAVNSSTGNITAFCSGGTAPYSISSIRVGGQTPDSVSGTQSGFSYSTNLTVTDYSMTNLQGVGGTLTVSDSAGASSTYNFSITTSGSSASTGCTLTASSSSVAANTSVTLTAVGNTSWGTAPFAFSSLSLGTNGVVTQALASTSTAQAQAIVQYSAAGSAAPSVSVMDATGKSSSCSTSLVITASTGTAPTCYLTQTIGANNNVSVQAVANDGQALSISNLAPGANGTIYSAGNPTVISYSAAGSKTVTANAASVATGLSCNGGAALSTTFYAPASTGSGSSMTCSVAQTFDSQGRAVFTATSSNGQALAFANFNAGADGTVVTNANPMVVAYSTSGTKTISTQAYSTSTGTYCNGGAIWTQSFYANASVGGGGLSCSYQLTSDAAQRLVIRLIASTGEDLSIVNVNPGSGGSIYIAGNPTTLAYSTAGVKNISLQAYSPSRGLWCGNGAAVSISTYAPVSSGTSGGPLACTVVLSANPVSRGQTVVAGFQSTGGYGAVSLLNIGYSAYSGVSGVFTSATQANLNFGYSGIVPITLTVRDSVGAIATCNTSVTVY